MKIFSLCLQDSFNCRMFYFFFDKHWRVVNPPPGFIICLKFWLAEKFNTPPQIWPITLREDNNGNNLGKFCSKNYTSLYSFLRQGKLDFIDFLVVCIIVLWRTMWLAKLEVVFNLSDNQDLVYMPSAEGQIQTNITFAWTRWRNVFNC